MMELVVQQIQGNSLACLPGGDSLAFQIVPTALIFSACTCWTRWFHMRYCGQNGCETVGESR